MTLHPSSTTTSWVVTESDVGALAAGVARDFEAGPGSTSSGGRYNDADEGEVGTMSGVEVFNGHTSFNPPDKSGPGLNRKSTRKSTRRRASKKITGQESDSDPFSDYYISCESDRGLSSGDEDSDRAEIMAERMAVGEGIARPESDTLQRKPGDQRFADAEPEADITLTTGNGGPGLMRKPTVIDKDNPPPQKPLEDLPNSPSPFSPNPRSNLPGVNPPGSKMPQSQPATEAPSLYSRPSWQGPLSSFVNPKGISRPPSTAPPMPYMNVTKPLAINRGTGGGVERGSMEDQARAESNWYANQAKLRTSGLYAQNAGAVGWNDLGVGLGGTMTSAPGLMSHGGNQGQYGTFDQSQNRALVGAYDDVGAQTLDHPRTDVAPIPVSTPRVAMNMPSANVDGSFGQQSTPRPDSDSKQQRYGCFRRFWITYSGLFILVHLVLATVLMNMVTRAFSSPLGTILRVPNREFTLTAAGESPLEVMLGLEGWCLGGGMSNCTEYWDRAFGTPDNLTIPAK